MATPTVIFNYSAWVAAYPTFKNILQPEATEYFCWADSYFANCGWTGALPQAPRMLNLLTCHLAWLFALRDLNGLPSSTGTLPAPQTVGRISAASEGSVNVTLTWDGSGSPSEAFFIQTPWGSAFWQAKAQFRTARYVPGIPSFIPNRAYPSIGYPYARRYW
jgi:hypothetical protein